MNDMKNLIVLYAEENLQRCDRGKPSAFGALLLDNDGEFDRLGAKDAAKFIRDGGKLLIKPGSVKLGVWGPDAIAVRRFADSALGDVTFCEACASLLACKFGEAPLDATFVTHNALPDEEETKVEGSENYKLGVENWNVLLLPYRGRIPSTASRKAIGAGVSRALRALCPDIDVFAHFTASNLPFKLGLIRSEYLEAYNELFTKLDFQLIDNAFHASKPGVAFLFLMSRSEESVRRASPVSLRFMRNACGNDFAPITRRCHVLYGCDLLRDEQIRGDVRRVDLSGKITRGDAVNAIRALHMLATRKLMHLETVELGQHATTELVIQLLGLPNVLAVSIVGCDQSVALQIRQRLSDDDFDMRIIVERNAGDATCLRSRRAHRHYFEFVKSITVTLGARSYRSYTNDKIVDDNRDQEDENDEDA
jgi:hypothetical protein